MKVYVWGDREIEEGNETTEEQVKTIGQWTWGSENRKGGGDESNQRSTSRNGEETIESARYDAIVMSLRVSVGQHTCPCGGERD